MKLDKGKTYYTVTDVADATSVLVGTIWWRVYKAGMYPEPEHRIKDRFYYDENVFRNIVKEIKGK